MQSRIKQESKEEKPQIDAAFPFTFFCYEYDNVFFPAQAAEAELKAGD